MKRSTQKMAPFFVVIVSQYLHGLQTCHQLPSSINKLAKADPYKILQNTVVPMDIFILKMTFLCIFVTNPKVKQHSFRQIRYIPGVAGISSAP